MSQAIPKIPVAFPDFDKIMQNPYDSEHARQLIFDFFEEVEQSSGSSSESSSHGFDGRESVDENEEEEDEDDNASKVEAAKAFWDSQEELLLATLRRTTSLESKIRQAIKETLMELKLTGVNCNCRKGVANCCRECTRNEICNRIRKAGYSCTICKSKWRGSPEIPAGEHTYMEVVQSSTSKKGEVKVIIELNFQAEFEMARACEEYNQLVSRLPEVFVGKIERLRTLIKILCSASKKCMKEKKMHMAPWRKHKYMQAKWLGRPEFQPELAAILPIHFERPPRAKASMLTFDLLDNLHQATMIKVV